MNCRREVCGQGEHILSHAAAACLQGVTSDAESCVCKRLDGGIESGAALDWSSRVFACAAAAASAGEATALHDCGERVPRE